MSYQLHYKSVWTLFGKSRETLTAQKSVISQTLGGQTWWIEQCMQSDFFMSHKAAKKSEPLLTKVFVSPVETSSWLTHQHEKITKIILKGILLPENIQYSILVKPWKIKFWCGNSSSSYKRNAFGKQFKFIHGQKTRQTSCGHWSCWMTWSETWTSDKHFYIHSLLG